MALFMYSGDIVCSAWEHAAVPSARSCINDTWRTQRNLQNLPSGSTYGKYAKSIFEAPEGKLMAFADFSSLEDYISALQSKDPNKLKVYLGHEVFKLSYGTEEEIIRDDSTIRIGGDLFKVTELMEYCDNPEEIFPPDKQYDTLFRVNIDTMNQPIRLEKIGNTSGYDGHSVRAFSYFPQKLPGIVDNVQSINSIKKLFDPVRGDSKGPTFQLTLTKPSVLC